MNAGGPYFTIELDEAGDWRARLFGANGELVWMTEGYERRQGAEDAIAILREDAEHAPIVTPAGD